MAEVICVAGPTACGKTGLAISLAKAYNGEVVSCDSMQIYRGMDIGTAKPTAQEMESVPHHMLDVADPAEDFSVSQYVAMADRAVKDILSRGKTAVIAGGTGLYMDSLIAGREFAPFPQDGRRQKLEAEADEKGMEPMLERLRQVDPQTAERLHPSDRKRILRALEVYEQTGKPLSWYNAQSRQQPPKYRPVWIGIDYVNRQTLYDRINRRMRCCAGDWWRRCSDCSARAYRPVPRRCRPSATKRSSARWRGRSPWSRPWSRSSRAAAAMPSGSAPGFAATIRCTGFCGRTTRIFFQRQRKSSQFRPDTTRKRC